MAKVAFSFAREHRIAGLRSRRGASFALLGLTHADVDAVVDFVCNQAHHRRIFYVLSTISLRLPALLASEYLEARGARGAPQAFQRVLKKVKDRPPMAGDER